MTHPWAARQARWCRSAHGLVAKERHGADARGNNTVLTEAGAARVREAQSTHLRIARARVLDHIPPDALPLLAETLSRLTEATVAPRD